MVVPEQELVTGLEVLAALGRVVLELMETPEQQELREVVVEEEVGTHH